MRTGVKAQIAVLSSVAVAHTTAAAQKSCAKIRRIGHFMVTLLRSAPNQGDKARRHGKARGVPPDLMAVGSAVF